MKILVYGPSGTLGTGYGVVAAERFPALLASQLERNFPDRDIELDVRPWRYFSPGRRESILEEIEHQKPDYLVMEATPNWVYLTTWAAWARRRLPRKFWGHVNAVDRLDAQVRESLHERRWLRHTYELPVALLARLLVRREPVYTAPNVVEFFSSLINAAKRHESMDLIVTNHSHISEAHTQLFPQAPQSAEQLAAVLKTECRKHHVRFVDYSEGLQLLPQSELFLPDAVHFSVAAKQREAEMLAGAILDAERAFS